MKLLFLAFLICQYGFGSGGYQIGGSSSSGGLSAAVTSINGDTTAAQVITSGTAGTDVAVSSSGGTTTVNVPTASATARGVVSTGSQTIAGTKIFSGRVVAGSTTENNSVTGGILGKGVTSYNGTDPGYVITMAQGLQGGGVSIAGYTDEADKSTLNAAAGSVNLGANGVGFYTAPAATVGNARTWTNHAGFKTNGDFIMGSGFDGGSSAANATDAVAPFFHLNTCAGTPTGTPTNSITGKAPIIIDTTNHKLYAYYGGSWHNLSP
jgi:hypothetical protein